MPLLFWQSNWNMSITGVTSQLVYHIVSTQSYGSLNLLLRLCSFIYCQHPVSDCTHFKSLHDVTTLLVWIIMFSKAGDDIEAAVNLGLIIAQKKHCNKTTKRKQLYFIHPLLLFLFLSQQVESFLWEPTSRRGVYQFGTNNETSSWAEELVAEM